MPYGARGICRTDAGGGRYHGLVEALGGPPTPAIGFAIGFDRLAEIVGQRAEEHGRRGEPGLGAADAQHHLPQAIHG